MSRTPPNVGFGRRVEEMISSPVYSGLNGAAIAKRWGVKEAMVSYYRNGLRLPSMTTAIRIAMDSGYSIEWILTGRGPKHPAADDDDDDGGVTLDLSGLSHEQQVHLRALVHAVQEQVAGYEKKKVSND